MPHLDDRIDFVGLDFGTTNSTVAIKSGDTQIRIATFPFRGAETPSFRSVLYFEQVKSASGVKRAHSLTGPAAIERYLEAEEKGRLIQSLKSHLSNRGLTGTEIFGHRYKLEGVVSRMLGDLRKNVEHQFGRPIGQAMVGRPVRFVGAETNEDDDFAVARLREAFAAAGFERVDFEMEPVAAACAYESTLDHDELILIGDFGGGTSDFSILRVGPGVRSRGRTAQDLLGNSGVGLAGDAFDARIVRKLVSPALGSNSEARSLNKLLPAVPAWIYANLERWHYLSFLRTNNVREILKSARARALEPEKIEALIAIVDEDLGYQLHQAVQQVKFELSRSHTAEFRFRDGNPRLPGPAFSNPVFSNIDLRIPVTRAEFEQWIANELHAIELCIDSLVRAAGVHPRDIDCVFLTGGSSFVPAVRRIFAARFGEERIRGGNEFTSVAHGLALRAEELDRRGAA
ncbi:MAG: Hsp70 family protein [Terracidiphilus sp.]